MSDIAFRSQQFAQGAQQWSEEMQTRSSERYGQAIEGMGQSISQIPERAIGLAGGMQDLQLKQQEAESQLALDEMRRQKVAQDLMAGHAMLDLDIKTAQAREAKYMADISYAQARKAAEEMDAAKVDYSADTQRGLAMLTMRTKKRYDVSRGRLTEIGEASDDDVKRAESVLRGDRGGGGTRRDDRLRLAEALMESGDMEGAEALLGTLKTEAGVEPGAPQANKASNEVVNWIVGRLGEHGINESTENAASIGRYLSTQADAIHSLANSEQAKGRGRRVSRDEAMDWFLEWVSRDENFRRQLYTKAGIR